ncbi:right-handed parallel beta-helix repeat-containing protein [Croceicoccus sp. YJ47]|uniref:right-handed parallel beta-helix repeat-containing protein n=1 Tax=Croceicoccus sp. YJ47 TaxID=2798724 RepID=UPI001922C3E5|nr:right-handed parallel beta-helix repeat-containing protein [Croceicoccus sp. YJ47]QQN72991.1 right-handed parallel beta-helix repeat-containing protein [Croceicoccus sp. YJ47]
MTLDFTARALAKSSLLRNPTLFSKMSSREIPDNTHRIETTGHSREGLGVASYLCDALCTPELLAAHPRFVFRSANGKIFRLVGEMVTVEQGGALGDKDCTGKINDQPAIQATLDYAAAVHIADVVLTQRRYTLFNPVRHSPVETITARDGQPIVITSNVTLRGKQMSDLYFYGPNGEDLETNWQTVRTNAASTEPDAIWRGWGIMILGDMGGFPTDLNDLSIEELRIENIRLIGGQKKTDARPLYPASVETGDGWDVTAKGIGLWEVVVKRIHLRNVEIEGFKGELFYCGGEGPKETVLENCRFRETNGSAINPGGSGVISVSNCEFGNAHAGLEQFGRAVYKNTVFHDCDTFTVHAWPDKGGRYNPGIAWRNSDGTAATNRFINCEFERVRSIYLTSWTRGSIRLVDSSVILSSYLAHNLQDVDLAIDAWIDQDPAEFAAWKDMQRITAPLHIIGPDSLTQQIGSAPDGTYIEPPSHIHVRLRCHQSRAAKDAGLQWMRPVSYYGYLDQDTIVVELPDCEAANQPTNEGVPFAMPRFITGRFRNSQPESANPAMFGGGVHDTTYDGPSLHPRSPVIALRTQDTTVQNVTIQTKFVRPYGYADGQVVRLVHDSVTGVHSFRIAPDSTLRLMAPRVLKRKGDFLDLSYNARTDAWYEVGFQTGERMAIVKAADLAIPAIPAGGSARVPTPVADAVPGSLVTAAFRDPRPGIMASAQVIEPGMVEIVLFNAGATQFAGGPHVMNMKVDRFQS